MAYRVLPEPLSRLFLAYLRAPDHPCKLRLVGWLRRYLLRERLIATNYAGLRAVAMDERDFVQRHCMLFGGYEPEAAHALARHTRPGDVLWDVGAHVGTFSMLVHALVPVRVVAFEPDPKHAALLRFNAERCGLSFTVRQEALWDGEGAGELNLAAAANTGTNSLVVRTSSASTTVPLVRGDLAARSEAPPDVMKIDVEGAELHVLRGCAELLRDRPPRAILYECFSDERLAEVKALLAAAGYASSRIGASENWLAVHAAAGVE